MMKRSTLYFSKNLYDSTFWNRYDALIVDQWVYQRYLNWYALPPVFKLSANERNKSIATLQQLWDFFYRLVLPRNARIGIIGGGMVLDVGGFAAATWMRGIAMDFFPTTLLAQADAAYGGKNAINFHQTKNLIGTYYFPNEIHIIPAFLKSNSIAQIRSGLTEIVKHGILASASLFETVLHRKPQDDISTLEPLIKQSLAIKKHFVEQDPYETQGYRSLLNLGHTVGHALEALHGKHKHGEYIAVGLVVELLTAGQETIAMQLLQWMKVWKFPLEWIKTITPEAMAHKWQWDKKRKGSKGYFVKVQAIESAQLAPLDVKTLLNAFKHLQHLVDKD